MSAGELEHEWAGTPGKLIRERYRKAAAVIKNQAPPPLLHMRTSVLLTLLSLSVPAPLFSLRRNTFLSLFARSLCSPLLALRPLASASMLHTCRPYLSPPSSLPSTCPCEFPLPVLLPPSSTLRHPPLFCSPLPSAPPPHSSAAPGRPCFFSLSCLNPLPSRPPLPGEAQLPPNQRPRCRNRPLRGNSGVCLPRSPFVPSTDTSPPTPPCSASSASFASVAPRPSTAVHGEQPDGCWHADEHLRRPQLHQPRRGLAG